jgi:hypothetical protein
METSSGGLLNVNVFGFIRSVVRQVAVLSQKTTFGPLLTGQLARGVLTRRLEILLSACLENDGLMRLRSLIRRHACFQAQPGPGLADHQCRVRCAGDHHSRVRVVAPRAGIAHEALAVGVWGDLTTVP